MCHGLLMFENRLPSTQKWLEEIFCVLKSTLNTAFNGRYLWWYTIMYVKQQSTAVCIAWIFALRMQNFWMPGEKWRSRAVHGSNEWVKKLCADAVTYLVWILYVWREYVNVLSDLKWMQTQVEVNEYATARPLHGKVIPYPICFGLTSWSLLTLFTGNQMIELSESVA